MSVTPRDFTATQAGMFPFGLTNESVSAGLRRLAKEVESGAFAVQEVHFTDDVKRDDFAMQTWTLKFIAAQKKPAE